MKNKMKKIIAIGMIILFTLVFFACEVKIGEPASGGGETPKETEFKNPEQEQEKPQDEPEPAPQEQITDPPADEIPDGISVDNFPGMLGEKYYCRDDLSRSITFNQNATFTYEDEYGSTAGDFIADSETIYIRFYIEGSDEPDYEFDGYFTVIDMKNLQEMHGEIYTLEPFALDPVNPVSPVDTGEIKWQAGSIYISNEKGVAVEISQVSANEFWFDIVQMMDLRDMDKIYGLNSLSEIAETENSGYYVFCYGWAQIESDNAYFAMFDSYGFSLYEDLDAIDIFAGESTDWSHLRGQYMRIK